MKIWLLRVGGALLTVAAAIYLNNASWLASAPEGEVKIVAHRGVHQLYSREGLTNDTCTADRMLPPTHDYLENTLRSMAAAFAAGAGNAAPTLEFQERNVSSPWWRLLRVWFSWPWRCDPASR